MRNDTLKKRCIPILAVAAGLILASLSCTSIMPPTPTPTPTATSTPTDTPTPTNTPTITPTFTPSLTPTQSYTDWPVVLSDSFDDNTNNWYEGSSTDDYTKSVVSITDGQYLIDVTAIKPFFWALYPNVRNLSNFYLTADVQNITGPASADYGVAFRFASNNKYYFAIAAQDQMYGFMVLNNGNWSTIIDWTNSRRSTRTEPIPSACWPRARASRSSSTENRWTRPTTAH